MIGFKIDNRTIKREIFNYNGYLVPLSVGLICIFIALSDVVRCMRKPRKILCEKLSQVLKLVWCFWDEIALVLGKLRNVNKNFLLTGLIILGRGPLLVGQN